MSAVTIHDDLRAQRVEISYCIHTFTFCLLWSDGIRCHDLGFLILSFKLAFPLFPPSPSLGDSLVSLISAIRVVLSSYLRLLIFLPAILIPACTSSSPELLMMGSAYKLNKQGDNKQPCCTLFLHPEPVSCSILGSSSCFLTGMWVSQEAGKMVWYSHLFKSFPQFIRCTQSKALA